MIYSMGPFTVTFNDP